MTIQKTISVQGAILEGGPDCSCTDGAACATSISVKQTPRSVLTVERDINQPLPAGTYLDLLTLTGLTNATFFSIKVTGGVIYVRASSTNGGADMIWPVSQLLVLSNPTSGSELTALAVRGVGTIECKIAGTA